MRKTFLCRAALLLLVAPSAVLAGGSDYWGYSYRNIDVTAAGSSEYAANLARYCVRLDAMLTRILGIKTKYRPPTHIYALPPPQLKQYLGEDSVVSFRVAPYEITVLTNNAPAKDSDYWGAYFGYTAALLAADGQLRGPDWYMEGVPAVFASTTYKHGRVELGALERGYALTLGQGGSLIPMRIFLTHRKAEVVAASEHNDRMYDAQAWSLAHEVFVEGWHRADFGKYLDLMRQQIDAETAYGASFNISYEQLDKEFAAAISQHALAYMMDAPEEPAASRENAVQLSGAEVKGRLALLTVRYGHGPDAIGLANDALQTEPANQTALRALAMAQLAKGAYGESLATVDRLSALSLSDAAYADAGFVLSGLARAVETHEAMLPVDAAALRRRATEDYQHALAANEEDRRSRDGLAQLQGSH
jgi:hypothetical protein